jgi:hypothetical protein
MKAQDEVIKILESEYGMFYFDEKFDELVQETLDWYDGDVEQSVQSIVEKYDLEKSDLIW